MIHTFQSDKTSNTHKQRLLLIRLLTGFLLLLVTVPAMIAQKKPVTLNDVFMNRSFRGQSIRGMKWLKGEGSYSFTKVDKKTTAKNIFSADAGQEGEQLLVDVSALSLPDEEAPLSYEDYRWSNDDRFIVFTLKTNRIWRRSSTGNFAVYDVDKQMLRPLPSPAEGLRNVKISPDGQWVGYVYADNIWILNMEDGHTIQLTDDAAEYRYNGRFGWVYEEEFSIVDGWRWSPDSRRIAFWQEDESLVPEFTMTNWMPVHQKMIPIKYPKAGDPNPIEKIAVVDIESRAIRWMDLGAETDMYIPRIKWTNDASTLCIYRLNRLQNHLDLLFANVSTGETRVVLTEKSATGWIQIERGSYLRFLSGSDRFLWASEKDGWNHVYLYDYEGKELRQITSGQWEVTSVAGLSPDEDALYYVSTEQSPLERHLYRVGLGGESKSRLTRSAGLHRINMNPSATTYLDSWSSTEQPSISRFFSVDGDELRTVSQVEKSVYNEYNWVDKEIFSFTTSDGIELDCALYKPADFDPEKKYPVFFDVYGGPGSQRVFNTWPGAMNAWTVNEGFLLFQVDNRGSSGRGTAFKHQVYKKLGQWEANDYIEAAKYLGTLPYIDSNNIGIWGWSYGGYISALTLMKGGDVFRAAVSIAPVTDWKFYDTIYAERFMQRPEDNPEGYSEGSCLTHAADLKGNFLLVHGGLDDNVHVQNAMSLADALTSEGIQFDMRIYPNGTHGVAGGMKSRLGLFRYYMDFMKRHLQ